MLHAFDGATGAEIFAYVPYGVLPLIQNTASSSFARVPLVESSLTMHDVCSGTTWKTILVGTLGAGGRSVFALDVSSVVAPASGTSSFSASNVLWELNDVKLGKGIPTPVIGRAKNGSAWQVFVGNGYGSSDGVGYLFVVNALTGAYATTALSNAPSNVGDDTMNSIECLRPTPLRN